MLQQPGMDQLQSVLQPVAQPMMAASSLAENRRSPAFQQLKVVAEGLQGLSWLAYTGPSCGEHRNVALFWRHCQLFCLPLA
jgi:adenylyl cyclase-associated protein